jgi:Uncharacterized conserved protein
MKRQALQQVADQHILTIKKHGSHIPGSFAAEAIHDLRVEYKKLRALLRLLRLNMPESLKKLYKAAGKVRDLQVFLTIPVPAPVFIHNKQKQLFRYKENLVRVIEVTRFKKIKIAKDAPDNALEKFVQEKTAAIHILLLAGNAESHLHDIRKNYKDIIYANKHFGMDDESMNAMATQLGEFNDRCIALSLLQNRGDIPAEEHLTLDRLQATWQQEKDYMQAQLWQQIQQHPPV